MRPLPNWQTEALASGTKIQLALLRTDGPEPRLSDLQLVVDQRPGVRVHYRRRVSADVYAVDALLVQDTARLGTTLGRFFVVGDTELEVMAVHVLDENVGALTTWLNRLFDRGAHAVDAASIPVGQQIEEHTRPVGESLTKAMLYLVGGLLLVVILQAVLRK